MAIILATQETEIRRIMVQSQPRQIDCETLSQKYPSQERAGGVAQGDGALSSSSSTAKKKKIAQTYNQIRKKGIYFPFCQVLFFIATISVVSKFKLLKSGLWSA
jgi:hypothetical protein